MRRSFKSSRKKFHFTGKHLVCQKSLHQKPSRSSKKVETHFFKNTFNILVWYLRGYHEPRGLKVKGDERTNWEKPTKCYDIIMLFISTLRTSPVTLLSFLKMLSERKEMRVFQKYHLGLGEHQTRVLSHWSWAMCATLCATLQHIVEGKNGLRGG